MTLSVFKKVDFLRASLARKEFRYIVSGISSEAIEYSSFFLLLWTTRMLVFSNSVSFLLGIASGFIFHKLWSFKGDQKFKTSAQVIGYSLVATTNFALTNILVGIFVGVFRMPPGWGKLLTMSVTAILSFFLLNFIVFRHKRSAKSPIS